MAKAWHENPIKNMLGRNSLKALELCANPEIFIVNKKTYGKTYETTVFFIYS